MTVNAINSLIKIYKISIVLFSWCRYRCLWKIPCFLSKLSLFSSCDSQADVCGLFMTSDFECNNPRTAGIGRNCGGKWHRRFNLQTFFAFQKPEIYHISWYFEIRFSTVFLSPRSNPSTLERKCHTGAYKGTQGHPLLLIAPPILFLYPSLEKRGNVQPLLTFLSTRVYIPQAALPTFGKGGFYHGYFSSFSFS